MSEKVFVLKTLLVVIQAMLVATQIVTGKWWICVPVILITVIVWNI